MRSWRRNRYYKLIAVKVSIVIPAHNEDKTIASTIQSCLDQSMKPFEIIVVNDGSTDRTKDFVEMMRIRNPELKLINFDKGHSAAFARNRGAEKATGDVLVFLDADMMPTENDFISKIDTEFSNPEVKAAYFASCGEYKTFIQRCQRVRVELTKFFLRQASGRRFSVNAIRTDLFREIGGYDEKVFYYEDAELTDRVQAKTDIRLIDTMVCHDEPRTFGEFVSQSKNVGKGIGTSSLPLKDPITLFSPHNPLFWLVFLLCTLLVPITDLPFFLFIGFILAEIVIAFSLTKDVLASVFYILILSPIRSIMIAYSFIREKFGKDEALPYGVLVIFLMVLAIALPTLMNAEQNSFEKKASIVTQRLNATVCGLRQVLPKESTCEGYAIPIYLCVFQNTNVESLYYYDMREDGVYPTSKNNYSIMKGECR